LVDTKESLEQRKERRQKHQQGFKEFLKNKRFGNKVIGHIVS
jgi:hypothetical protein